MEVARFVESMKAKPQLLDKDEYIFTANQKRGNWIYWKCRQAKSEKCPARATTKGIYVTKWKDVHNHQKTHIQHIKGSYFYNEK